MKPFILFLLPLLTSFTLANASSSYLIPPPKDQPLLAIFLHSNNDLIPALVLISSFRKHSQLSHHPTLFALPSVSHHSSYQHVSNLNISYVPLSATPFPLVSLFNLTSHPQILHIKPQSLVTSSLEHLSKCSTLCASFLAPCSFSSSPMVLTPSKSTYQRLMALSSTHCVTSTPDWLSPDLCLLNHQFSHQLLSSPLLTPTSTNISRLPPSTSLPHFLFYPRMRFEAPDNCGPHSIIDFSSPPILSPTLSFPYLLADLVWTWRSARLEASVAEATSIYPFLLVTLSLLLIVLFYSLSRLPSFSSLPSPSSVLRLSLLLLSLSPVIWLLSFLVVPANTGPYHSFILIILTRLLLMTFLVAFLTRFRAKPRISKSLFLITLDTILLLGFTGLGGQTHAETMAQRFRTVCTGAAIGAICSVGIIIRLAEMWTGASI